MQHTAPPRPAMAANDADQIAFNFYAHCLLTALTGIPVAMFWRRASMQTVSCMLALAIIAGSSLLWFADSYAQLLLGVMFALVIDAVIFVCYYTLDRLASLPSGPEQAARTNESAFARRGGFFTMWVLHFTTPILHVAEDEHISAPSPTHPDLRLEAVLPRPVAAPRGPDLLWWGGVVALLTACVAIAVLAAAPHTRLPTSVEMAHTITPALIILSAMLFIIYTLGIEKVDAVFAFTHMALFIVAMLFLVPYCAPSTTGMPPPHELITIAPAVIALFNSTLAALVASAAASYLLFVAIYPRVVL